MPLLFYLAQKRNRHDVVIDVSIIINTISSQSTVLCLACLHKSYLNDHQEWFNWRNIWEKSKGTFNWVFLITIYDLDLNDYILKYKGFDNMEFYQYWDTITASKLLLKKYVSGRNIRK